MPDFDSLASIPVERRWRSSTMPAPVVVCLICQDTGRADGQPAPRFLLIQRADEPYRGRWALVGGKWDFGESLAAAAVREVLEETGLEAKFVALRGIVSERLLPTEQDPADVAHFLLLVCQVDVGDGQASEQNEGAVAWFTEEQIDDLNRDRRIIPSDYLMLQRFVAAPEIPLFEADMSGHGPASDEMMLFRFERVS